jgi:hypothetical protein
MPLVRQSEQLRPGRRRIEVLVLDGGYSTGCARERAGVGARCRLHLPGVRDANGSISAIESLNPD